MPDNRKDIARSLIYSYWKDKAITDNGDIVLENDADYNHSIPVIEDPIVPQCWCCGKRVNGIQNTKRYKDKLSDGKIDQLYNIGSESGRMERCHIVAHSFGGNDEPSNLFLLCHDCHKESPDTNNPRNFFRWVFNERKHFPRTVVNYRIDRIMDEVFKLCERLGKDPYSGDFKDTQCYPQGALISESSIIYAYVDSCETVNIQ